MLIFDNVAAIWNIIEGLLFAAPTTIAVITGYRALKKNQKEAIKESAKQAIEIVTTKYTLIEKEVILKLDSIKNVIDSLCERMDKLEASTQNQIKEFREEIKSIHEKYSKLSIEFNTHVVNSDNYVKRLNDMNIRLNRLETDIKILQNNNEIKKMINDAVVTSKQQNNQT